jgi:hypothetical protein
MLSYMTTKQEEEEEGSIMPFSGYIVRLQTVGNFVVSVAKMRIL